MDRTACGGGGGDRGHSRHKECKGTGGEVCLDSVVRESEGHEVPQLRVLIGHIMTRLSQ